MRALGVIALLFVTATMASAQAPVKPAAPPALEEMDALKIGKLMAERQAIQNAYDTSVARQELLKREFADKTTALNVAVDEAAQRGKVVLKDGWKPDVEKRIWVKD